MRFSLIALICICFSLVSFTTGDTGADDNEAWRTRVGQEVPSFNFQLRGGQPLSIDAYRGKVVLLNFFATWCPHCRRELPHVQEQLWDKHGENPDFEVLVLAREEDWDKLDPFIEQHGYTFPIIPDLDRKVFSKFAPQTIPRNVILDRNGIIIYQSIGYSSEEFAKMVSVIEQELAGD